MPSFFSSLFLSTSLALASKAGAEVLDTLGEYGNAATANAASAAGTPRGFTSSAPANYTITAGGSDFWGGGDKASFLYDADLSQSGDFSAIVRSVSVAANPLEGLAAEWGRSGPAARRDPTDRRSAIVGHFRKSGGADPHTVLQGRPLRGAATDSTGGEFDNGAANIANGSVRNTPIWLALHRFEGRWFASWAPDVAGTPGPWSDALERAGSVDMDGEVFVGLGHQSHGAIHPEVNTAAFESFAVTGFDPDLGGFPLVYDFSLVPSGDQAVLSASGTEIGDTVEQAVDWAVEFYGSDFIIVEDGTGAPDGMVLNNRITSEIRELRLLINGEYVETVSVVPAISSAKFTEHSEATIVVADVATGGTADVDPTTVVVRRNGEVIAPSVTKDGLLTTIVDTSATDPYQLYTYTITGNKTAATGGGEFDVGTTLRSFPLRETLRAGLDPPPGVGTWHFAEFSAFPLFPEGLVLGEQGFRDAQDVIRDTPPVTEGEQPYINHSDPDTTPARGDWQPDLPFLSDTAASDDNHFVLYARTTLTIEPGSDLTRTFSIRGDDGYALRITGASFSSVSGLSANTIDPDEPSTVFFPAFGVNSDTFAICDFPTAGDYQVEFIGFEGQGDAFQELSWAPGAVTELEDSNQWQLVGNGSGHLGQSTFGEIPHAATPPLPLADGEEGWSLRMWHGTSVRFLVFSFDFFDEVAAGDMPFTHQVDTFAPALNHSDEAVDAGVINPSLPFPNDPLPGAESDGIVMVARARIVAPADGDYTLQIRSDDGFLLRLEDPTKAFHTVNGKGVLHGNAPFEVYFPFGTGDSDTRASVFLTAGTHDVSYLWWNGVGGAHFEISSAPGIVASNAPSFQLLTPTPSPTHLFLGKAEPALRFTDIAYNEATEQFTLRWTARPGEVFALRWATDATNWGADISDSITAASPNADPLASFDGEIVTYGPFANPAPGLPVVLFRAEKQ